MAHCFQRVAVALNTLECRKVLELKGIWLASELEAPGPKWERLGQHTERIVCRLPPAYDRLSQLQFDNPRTVESAASYSEPGRSLFR